MNALNKKLGCVAILLAGLFSISPAHAWTKVFDCVSSNAVIDREEVARGPARGEGFQIVFRDQQMIGQLLESGAVATRRLTSLNEIVLMIHQNEFRPQEWVGEADAFDVAGVVYFVKPDGNAVTFEAFRTTQSAPGSYVILENIGTWRMNDCRQP